ncbi:hypothetical protein AFM11_30130 [Mycolicibacterium wolinskyi]|uniref:Uncharacterized protein n=1 Tax=Mycolicibacterium wolinskyi TaxID=59750 RepID=A0A132PDS0_9MYCO|nr:hypothetical protein [Mycolicibacterium wolinskyi]KWX20444.1 hypothetical protein AFM11_30130 [Mycolicibacterium wolinskyi]
MAHTAAHTLARVRHRYQQFIGDPRSVLDRPALADTTDRFAQALADAFDHAVEALAACTSAADPAAAAAALADAQAAEYALDLADQHARRKARHGLYPGATPPLYARKLDLIEEARASLELATQASDSQEARSHRRRAHTLIEAAQVDIPELLEPAWTTLTDDDGLGAHDAPLCSTKIV